MKAKAKILLEIFIALSFIVYETIFIKNLALLHLLLLIFGYIIPFMIIPGKFPFLTLFNKERKYNVIKQILLAFPVLIISDLIFFSLYFLFLESLPLNISISLFPILGMTNSQILSIIILKIRGGIVEELFYRNYLDNRFGMIFKNDYIRIIVIACIFSLVHLPNWSYNSPNRYVNILLLVSTCAYPFWFSLVFGLAKKKFKNFTLLSCMLGHITSNIFGQLILSVSFSLS